MKHSSAINQRDHKTEKMKPYKVLYAGVKLRESFKHYTNSKVISLSKKSSYSEFHFVFGTTK